MQYGTMATMQLWQLWLKCSSCSSSLPKIVPAPHHTVGYIGCSEPVEVRTFPAVTEAQIFEDEPVIPVKHWKREVAAHLVQAVTSWTPNGRKHFFFPIFVMVASTSVSGIRGTDNSIVA